MDLKALFEKVTSEEVVGKLKQVGDLVKGLVSKIAEEIQAVDSEDISGVEKRAKVTKLVVKNVLMPVVKELPLPAGFILDKIIEAVLLEFTDDLVEIVYQLLVKKFKG